jgi:hypothetical protein
MASRAVISVVLSSLPAVAAVSVDTLSKASTDVPVSGLSWSHMASGIDRYVIVGMSSANDTIATVTATYGGAAMTLLGTVASADSKVRMFGLVNPPAGSQTVILSFSSPCSEVSAGAISLYGVDQQNPAGDFQGAFGATATCSNTLQSAAADLVVDVVAADSATVQLTPGPGQNVNWSVVRAQAGASSTKPGAPLLTMTWSASAPVTWELGAVSVHPSQARADAGPELVDAGPGDAGRHDAGVLDAGPPATGPDDGGDGGSAGGDGGPEGKPPADALEFGTVACSGCGASGADLAWCALAIAALRALASARPSARRATSRCGP